MISCLMVFGCRISWSVYCTRIHHHTAHTATPVSAQRQRRWGVDGTAGGGARLLALVLTTSGRNLVGSVSSGSVSNLAGSVMLGRGDCWLKVGKRAPPPRTTASRERRMAERRRTRMVKGGRGGGWEVGGEKGDDDEGLGQESEQRRSEAGIGGVGGGWDVRCSWCVGERESWSRQRRCEERKSVVEQCGVIMGGRGSGEG